MNKDKMIENIADYIQIASDLYRIECIKVAKYLVENKNCRIIADDEIVIKSDIKCVDSTTAVNVIDFFAKYNAKVRQETARKIFTEYRIHRYMGRSEEAFKEWLCREFDVELE